MKRLSAGWSRLVNMGLARCRGYLGRCVGGRVYKERIRSLPLTDKDRADWIQENADSCRVYPTKDSAFRCSSVCR